MLFIKTITQAGKTVFANKHFRSVFFVLVPVIFFLLVSIPVNAVPSNDYRTQFSLYKPGDYITLAVVSSFLSLFFLMHVYNFTRVKRAREKVKALGGGGVGSSTGVLASIFGAVTCPMCVASIFGFLGFGAVGVMLRHQWWIFGASLIIMLFSLYFIAKKVNGICEKCL